MGGLLYWQMLWLLAGGGVAAAGGLVYVTHLERVPVTGRSHFVALSASMEQRLGAKAHASLLAQFRDRVLVSMPGCGRGTTGPVGLRSG